MDAFSYAKRVQVGGRDGLNAKLGIIDYQILPYSCINTMELIKKENEASNCITS